MRVRQCVLACALVCAAFPVVAQAPYSRFNEKPVVQQETTADQGAWSSWSERSAAALAASVQPRELAFAAVLRNLANTAPANPENDTPSQPAAPDPQAAAWR